jgi:IS30 family transposase
MDKRYKHLNGEERGVILAEHRRGASLGAIGLLLGRSASTIGRERFCRKFCWNLSAGIART